jgi:anti-sigma factor RsiW
MRDCDNVTMREMLPDLLHDRLAPSVRANLESHLKACADCRAELELLRSVVSGAVTPRIDASRIAAAVPAYQRPSAVMSALRSWPLRAAAAVVLVVGTVTFLKNTQTTLEPDTLVAAAAPGLAVGAMTDIPDQDLRALAAELKKLQAVTPAEPEVVVPGVGRGSE